LGLVFIAALVGTGVALLGVVSLGVSLLRGVLADVFWADVFWALLPEALVDGVFTWGMMGALEIIQVERGSDKNVGLRLRVAGDSASSNVVYIPLSRPQQRQMGTSNLQITLKLRRFRHKLWRRR